MHEKEAGEICARPALTDAVSKSHYGRVTGFRTELRLTRRANCSHAIQSLVSRCRRNDKALLSSIHEAEKHRDLHRFSSPHSRLQISATGLIGTQSRRTDRRDVSSIPILSPGPASISICSIFPGRRNSVTGIPTPLSAPRGQRLSSTAYGPRTLTAPIPRAVQTLPDRLTHPNSKTSTPTRASSSTSGTRTAPAPD